MKLRIWHNCLVVGDFDVTDDGLTPTTIADDEDCISIDPWTKLAGETRDNVTKVVNIGIDLMDVS